MRRVALGCFLTALLSGCPGERATPSDAGAERGPAAINESEPNDTQDKSLVLTGDSEVTATLSADPAKPDQDWYAIQPSAPSEVDALLSGIPGGDVQLALYDADRNRILLVNGEGEGKPERIPNLFADQRRWLVVSGKRGTGGAYTLTVRFREPTPGSEREPNERAADAQELALGEAITGRIGHAADEDWYRITLPAPGEEDAGIPGGEEALGEAALQPPPPETPPASENGEEAGSEQTAPAEGVPPAPESGPVAAPGDSETLRAITDLRAPPDAPKFAFPIEPPGSALRLELTPVEGVRLEVSVLSEAEAEIFRAAGVVGEQLSVRNVGVRAVDRTLYVVVKSGWTGTGKNAQRAGNPEASYKLTVALEEAGATAELEPNDQPLKATLIAADGFREGFLSPSGDVDYFALQTTQPVLARFQLSGVERTDLALSVVAPPQQGAKEQVLLRANDGAIKEPEILNNVRCSGTCFLKVESAARKVEGRWVADFSNAEVPYRLSASIIPDNGAEEAEPNDSVLTATPLRLGAPIRGTVHPKKDSDYYLLDLRTRQVKTALRATALGVLKVDVGLYLHRVEDDGATTLLQTADRAKGEQPETIRYTVEPGQYVVEVRDARNRESNFLDSYQLTVRTDD